MNRPTGAREIEKRRKTLFLKHIVRKIFLEDWAMKLIALAITLGLWLGVTVFTKQGTARLTVPINFRPSDNAILTSSAVKDVTIRVSGDDRKIRDLSPADIRIFLDLTDVEPGEKIITIDPQSVSHNLPSGVRLEDIQPRGIPIKLEAAVIKELPVQPDIYGTPAKGFEVYDDVANPQRVRVRGPASYVQNLAYLTTEKVDVSERSDDLSLNQVLLKVANENVTLSDTVVDVTVHIGEKRIEKTFMLPSAGSSKKVSVVLYGSPTVLEAIKTESIKVETSKDANGIESSRVELPDNVAGSVEVRKPTKPN